MWTDIIKKGELPNHYQIDETTYLVAKNLQAFPAMSESQYNALKRDIESYGQLVPIVYSEHEGKYILMDGRHRLMACQDLTISPWLEAYNGTLENAAHFILSLNGVRKHYSETQLSEIRKRLRGET